MTNSTDRADRIIRNQKYLTMLEEISNAEKNRKFCCHTIQHFFDTARIMYIICLEENLDIPKDIIYAAALLHDIGRAEEYKSGKPHNIASAETAENILNECGFTENEIIQISNAILCHRKIGSADTELGDILYRADKLSRQCFLCSAYDECYWS